MEQERGPNAIHKYTYHNQLFKYFTCAYNWGSHLFSTKTTHHTLSVPLAWNEQNLLKLVYVQHFRFVSYTKVNFVLICLVWFYWFSLENISAPPSFLNLARKNFKNTRSYFCLNKSVPRGELLSDHPSLRVSYILWRFMIPSVSHSQNYVTLQAEI